MMKHGFLFSNTLVRQYFVVLLVNVNSFCTGFSLAWPSPVLVKLGDESETVLSKVITVEEGAWIASISYLCTLSVTFFVSYIADWKGRKFCIIIGSLANIATAIVYTLATEVWMLYLGRIFYGLAVSFLFSIIPIYTSEISSKEIRGSLGAIYQNSCVLGIFSMLAMGPFLDYITLHIVFIVIALVAAIPMFFLPDTPYYLYSKGRIDDSNKVLKFFNNSQDSVLEEMKQYTKSKDMKTSKMDIVKSFLFWKTLGIIIVVGIGGQLSGAYAVSTYLQTILKSSNSSIQPEIASVIVGSIQFTASLFTTFLTDRFGRKPIFICTFLGLSLGALGLGTFFELSNEGQNVSGFLNVLPLLSILIMIFSYSSGQGSLFYPLMTELFEGPARAIGVSVGITFTIITTFLTLKYFALVSIAIGSLATFLFFSISSLLTAIFITFCVPETKGKTFAEIQMLLSGKKLEYTRKNYVTPL